MGLSERGARVVGQRGCDAAVTAVDSSDRAAARADSAPARCQGYFSRRVGSVKVGSQGLLDGAKLVAASQLTKLAELVDGAAKQCRLGHLGPGQEAHLHLALGGEVALADEQCHVADE